MYTFGRFIWFIAVKSFFKKFVFGIMLFILAYFGFDELSVVKVAIGGTEHEITKQIDIDISRTINGSNRVMKYKLSNIGIKPITLNLKVSTPDLKPDFKLGSVFKIYSNTADERSIKITEERPYSNRLLLNINELKAGLGIELLFPDKPTHLNYLSQIDIKLDSSSSPNLYEHELNRSPLSIMTIRYFWLIFLSYCASAVFYSLFSFGLSVFINTDEF